MGWGYYKFDPKYRGRDFRDGVHPTHPRDVKIDQYYVLVGVEPDCMFRPGSEPQGLRFFHWDNSLQPWLRHITPANGTGHKLWSRLTSNSFYMPSHSPALPEQRARINRRLKQESAGVITDISELWRGTRPTQRPLRGHALICASSERNHREFFGETQAEWLERVTSELKRQGMTWNIRRKVGVEQRKTNQTTDQLARDGHDLLITNYSACASEAVVVGCPVITTTAWNPARSVSTTWEQFCQGHVVEYTEEQIEHWVTRLCAYTYHREELNSLSWIDHHPEAEDIRRLRYDQ